MNDYTLNIQNIYKKYIHWCIDTNIKQIQNTYIIVHQLKM
jgi:hypothetical protein